MTTTNEIPAQAMYIDPDERITRPNDGETIETRLGRLESAIRHHNEAEQEWRKRTRDLDAQLEQSMGRLNTWADHVEECLRMVDSNREQNDNVHEIILRHLGVDMSLYGDPPRMNAEQIATALGVPWPRPESATAGDRDRWVQVADAMRRDGAEGPVTVWDSCDSGTQEWFIALARAAVAKAIERGIAVRADDPRLQPLRPEPDLTLDVLRRVKDRDMHVIPAPWVSVVIACTVDALNARCGAAVYHDEQDG